MSTDLVPAAELTGLVQRARHQLDQAQTAAEVLDARDAAAFVYDAAKVAARLQQAKGAHDDLIAHTHRLQADALEIEAMAKRRLADEYDAAQERGEVAKIGDNLPSVSAGNAKPTAADVGLSRKDIHEARQIRDAEEADPGIVKRTIEAKLDEGQAPTKADLRRAVSSKTVKEQPPQREPNGLSGLSREGLEDEVVGLRAENAELRDRVKILTKERDDLEARWKEATAEDQGKTIGSLQRRVASANYARDEALAATKREEFKRKKAEARVAELEATPIDMGA